MADTLATGASVAQPEQKDAGGWFDFAPVASVVLTESGVVQASNQASEDLLSTAKELLTGQPLVTFLTTQSHEPFQRLLSEARYKQVAAQLEVVPRAGGPIHISMIAGPGRTHARNEEHDICACLVPVPATLGASVRIERVLAGQPLLDGENLETLDGYAARHWLETYRQLVEFKERTLARVRADLAALDAAARHDIVETDIAGLEEQLQRYQSRLEFWTARSRELRGLDLDGEHLIARYGAKSLRLTRREFELLKCLLEQTRPMPPASIAAVAWGDGTIDPAEVRTYIARLRKHLASLDSPLQLSTVRARGYQLL